MDADLQPVHTQVMQASAPEDLFGSEDVILPPETLLKYLGKKYDALKAVTGPASYRVPEDIEAATDADRKLEELYALAQVLIERHTYGLSGRGKPKPAYATKSFEVGPHRYYLGRQLRAGTLTSLYEAFMERDGKIVGEVVVKVATDPSHNPFVQNEVRILDILHQTSLPQWKHLPFVFDRFQSGGRVGLVQRKISGYTLADVRKHRMHKNGVDQRDMVWMFDRLLSCLGFVHSQGVIHGALDPENILIQPATHNALVCGWAGAVHKPGLTGEKVLMYSDAFSAPEVKARGRLGPWSDIYSLGKAMIWLLGGDPSRNEVPDGVAEPLQRLLRSMAMEDPYVRPSDAWQLYDEQVRIKDDLWPRKFRHFDMS